MQAKGLFPRSEGSFPMSAGSLMPPKATYFFPKLLTGIVFNPLI